MLQGGSIGRYHMDGGLFNDQLRLNHKRQVELLLSILLILLIDDANQARRNNIFLLQSKFTLTCKIKVNQQIRRYLFYLPLLNYHIVKRTFAILVRSRLFLLNSCLLQIVVYEFFDLLQKFAFGLAGICIFYILQTGPCLLFPHDHLLKRICDGG